MNRRELQHLLEQVKFGKLDIERAVESLDGASYQDIGFAKIDHQRRERTGYPEVIYCQGKSPEQIAEIIRCIVQSGNNVLGTRLSKEKYENLKNTFSSLSYDAPSQIMQLRVREIEKTGKGEIVVLTGGTSDIPVAEEAALTAEFFGHKVVRIYDVGVAGIHRLLDHKRQLEQARVIIAVAGMEGALASVVCGLVRCPVIGVPTSVGYGANFGGISALLSMLNSCAAGLSVVNIDNGFGAGYLASTINRL